MNTKQIKVTFGQFGNQGEFITFCAENKVLTDWTLAWLALIISDEVYLEVKA